MTGFHKGYELFSLMYDLTFYVYSNWIDLHQSMIISILSSPFSCSTLRNKKKNRRCRDPFLEKVILFLPPSGSVCHFFHVPHSTPFFCYYTLLYLCHSLSQLLSKNSGFTNSIKAILSPTANAQLVPKCHVPLRAVRTALSSLTATFSSKFRTPNVIKISSYCYPPSVKQNSD